MSVLGKPKAAVVEAVVGVVPAAAGGPAEVRIVVPGTTAEHPNRIVRLGFAVARIRLVGIQTPFQGY